MKKYLALLLLMASFTGFAQNKLYVPILPNECLNCVSHLAKLNDIDKSLPVSLVFPKRYKVDSAVLSKRMYLNDYKAGIVWSDSLFNRFKNGGNIKSSIGAYNEESGNFINVNIASIEDAVPFFNSLSRTDTVKLSSHAFGGETILKNSGRYIYCFDVTASEIRAFDKIDGQLLYTLSVTDSMVQAAFKLRYPANKWKKEYQEAKEFSTRKRRIDPNAFEAMYCSNDTIYATSHYAYIIRDTAYKDEATNFVALSIYKDGKMISFSIVENYIDPSFKGVNRGLHRITEAGDLVKREDAYYIMSGGFFVKNDTLYTELLGYLADGIPNHILGLYKKNAKNVYEHKGFYKGTLPSEYLKVGYTTGLFPGSGILYSYPYVALVYSNHVFSVSPDKPDLDLPILSQKTTGFKGIFGLRVSQNFAYIIYRDGKDKWMHYAKVDIQSNRIIQDVPYSDTSLPYIADESIDDFDYRFVYIPISEQMILRKKVLD